MREIVSNTENRNIIRALVIRRLFGSYKNSYLGFAWNFVTPIIYIVLSYFIYSQSHNNSKEDYIVFLASGMFAYNFLLNSITGGTTVFTSNSNIIKKMYIPKEILAISSAISSMIIALIGYVITIILIIALNREINAVALLYVPVILVASFVFYIGCSLFLGSITVYVRDIQYFLVSITIIFFVCTPIRDFASNSSGLIETVYWLNPLTYFIEPLHQIFYSAELPDLKLIGIMIALSAVAIVVGYFTYSKLKRGFVERL